MKQNKKSLVIVLSVAIAILLAFAITSIVDHNKKEAAKKAQEEQMAQVDKNIADAKRGVTITTIRAEIARERLDGSGKMTEQLCEELRGYVKDYSPESDWFDSCYGVFRFNLADTENSGQIVISDDNYCAKISHDMVNYEITDYTFDNSTCHGYNILVE